MRIAGMGPVELLIILGVILLIFGPKNLPKLGSALGKTVKNIRSGMEDDKEPEKLEQVKETTVTKVAADSDSDADVVEKTTTTTKTVTK